MHSPLLTKRRTQRGITLLHHTATCYSRCTHQADRLACLNRCMDGISEQRGTPVLEIGIPSRPGQAYGAASVAQHEAKGQEAIEEMCRIAESHQPGLVVAFKQHFRQHFWVRR